MTDTTSDTPPPASPWPAAPPPRDPAGLSPWARALAARARLIGKIGGLAVLALMFAIPLNMIDDVAGERWRLSETTRKEITSSWGGEQTLIGPYLLLPHESPRGRDEALLLPERLEVVAALSPQVRHRGMFEAVVYTLDLTLRGRFKTPETNAEGVVAGLRSDRVRLRLGAGDLRGLVVESVDIDGRTPSFEPAAQGENAIDAVIGAIDPARLADGVPFEIRLRLNGSGRVGFMPVGNLTTIDMTAPWPDPGFFGRFRPVAQRIGEDRFSARWQISILGRGFGQIASTADESRAVLMKRLNESVFGVELVQPVTPYRSVKRMLKYGLLTVGCAFALYLAFELAGRARLHPVQYALSGAAMALFPLILLSVGEHLGFTAAYSMATGIVVAQTSLYTWRATARARFAAMFGAASAALFAYLYLLLQAESWSLLGGSAVLVVLVAALMYATRDLGRRPAAEAAPAT
ncbi:MAG: inner membrane CreD family protein [Rhodospirillales bacterium]|nr:MAG: inner membrane CreD family protein [Rhodospirillales bacterium]